MIHFHVFSLQSWCPFAAFSGYITSSAGRNYYRDLDTMKRQLLSLSFDTARCSCCDNGHVNELGEYELCDRVLVKECVNLWFGSQEAFENTVRSEVSDILNHDLDSMRVFSTKWALAVTCPIMWGFMDFAAGELAKDEPLENRRALSYLLAGLGIWLTFPAVKDLVIPSLKLIRPPCGNACVEVTINFFMAFFAIASETVIIASCLIFSLYLLPASSKQLATWRTHCFMMLSPIANFKNFTILKCTIVLDMEGVKRKRTSGRFDCCVIT